MNPILVTGAGGQIAARTLEHLLERGHRVVAWVRKEEDRARLLHKFSENLDVVVADLTREDEVRDVIQRFSVPPGGWIHLAGMYRGGAFHDTSPEHLRTLMQINVETLVIPLKALLPRWLAMEPSPGVQVVALGAGSGLEGAAGSPFYAASKAALRVLIRSLDQAYAQKGVCFGILHLMHPADTRTNTSLPSDIPRIPLTTLAHTLVLWVEGKLGHLQELNLYA